ncbi:MAG: hypothetical protein ACRC5V_00140 [Aeromonas sp.]
MQFRITDNIKQPLIVRPFFKPAGRHRAQLRLTLDSLYSENIAATSIIVRVPAPANTQEAKMERTAGNSRFLKDGSAVEWKLTSHSGRSQAEFTVDFIVGTGANIADQVDLKDWKRPPITVRFELPLFTASGVEVQSVDIVSREGYSPNKWMRSLTQAGNYAIKW